MHSSNDISEENLNSNLFDVGTLYGCLIPFPSLFIEHTHQYQTVPAQEEPEMYSWLFFPREIEIRYKAKTRAIQDPYKTIITLCQFIQTSIDWTKPCCCFLALQSITKSSSVNSTFTTSPTTIVLGGLTSYSSAKSAIVSIVPTTVL